MIPPLASPPAQRTTHGAPMSPRLSRLYSWLKANHVALQDFSTDQCVQREWPALVKLRDALDRLRAEAPAEYLDHLAADLGAVMRRLPQNRVAARRG